MTPAWFDEFKTRVERVWPSSAPKTADVWAEWWEELDRFGGELVLGAVSRMIDNGRERITLPGLIATIRESQPATPAPRPDPDDCTHPRFAFPPGPNELPPLEQRVQRVSVGTIEMTCALCLGPVLKDINTIRTQGELEGWVR